MFKKRKEITERKPSISIGYTPIAESLEDDIFIVGYPKSGNTWFQNLVAGVVHGVMPDFAPPALAHRVLIPDVHSEQHYIRFSTPTFFKSHHLPQAKYRKVVYIVRDGRDVMVSYYHYMKAMQEKIDFLEMVKTKFLFPCKWHEHVEAWLANPHASQMITIKYEHLIKDPVAELKRFCDFTKVERDVSFIAMIAEAASFKNLQDRERRVGMGAKHPKWQDGKMFFRRGRVGDFKEEMPEPVLHEFLEQAAPTMKKLGYDIT